MLQHALSFFLSRGAMHVSIQTGFRSDYRQHSVFTSLGLHIAIH